MELEEEGKRSRLLPILTYTLMGLTLLADGRSSSAGGLGEEYDREGLRQVWDTYFICPVMGFVNPTRIEKNGGLEFVKTGALFTHRMVPEPLNCSVVCLWW